MIAVRLVEVILLGTTSSMLSWLSWDAHRNENSASRKRCKSNPPPLPLGPGFDFTVERKPS